MNLGARRMRRFSVGASFATRTDTYACVTTDAWIFVRIRLNKQRVELTMITHQITQIRNETRSIVWITSSKKLVCQTRSISTIVASIYRLAHICHYDHCFCYAMAPLRHCLRWRMSADDRIGCDAICDVLFAYARVSWAVLANFMHFGVTVAVWCILLRWIIAAGEPIGVTNVVV